MTVRPGAPRIKGFDYQENGVTINIREYELEHVRDVTLETYIENPDRNSPISGIVLLESYLKPQGNPVDRIGVQLVPNEAINFTRRDLSDALQRMGYLLPVDVDPRCEGYLKLGRFTEDSADINRVGLYYADLNHRSEIEQCRSIFDRLQHSGLVSKDPAIADAMINVARSTFNNMLVAPNEAQTRTGNMGAAASR